LETSSLVRYADEDERLRDVGEELKDLEDKKDDELLIPPAV